MSVKLGDTDIAGLVEQLPSQTGNAGKYLYTDGTNASWEEASTAQIWIGTQAEYEALGTYDPEVVYQVTDDFQNLIPNVGQITEDVNDLKAHAVVEFQVPTAQNNYTWYRKYADGWVEQGGVATTTNTSTPTQCNLPVAMADGGYCITYGPTTQSMAAVFLAGKQTTYFSVITGLQNVGYFAASFNWQVSGMAA
jgi:hypothetical protein